jgi:response regulator RpfG family c-di-GMP phosphodiesterase
VGEMDKHKDEFFYAEREDKATVVETRDRWKIMIVDDEEEVHEVTKITLNEFTYDGKKLEFLHAYSGREAKNLIEKHPGTALILLDVVMETDDAGLQVVKYIRETLKNTSVRIILRTGQPGQAPEKEVVRNYDINDYKEKSELTIQKLFTVIFSSLRSYRDIVTLNENRLGLKKIIESSNELFELQSMEKFSSGVLKQLIAILRLDEKPASIKSSGFLTDVSLPDPVILAGKGLYEERIGAFVKDAVDDEISEKLARACKEKSNGYYDGNCVIYFQNKNNVSYVVYLQSFRELNEWDRRLVEIFCSNVSVAFDNVYLYKQFNIIQESAIMSLAKLAEYKDTDTGEHIQRVSDMTSKIAKKLYEKNLFKDVIDANFVQYVGLASILHDVGKVGVPERILLKPGKLTEKEWEKIKQHPIIGGVILNRAAEKLGVWNYIKIAADIALYHHEKFDGSGYPFGRRENEIPLSARIVAVVDVYDALISKRPYKEAFPHEKAVEIIKSEAGKAFDPEVVDAMLEMLTVQERDYAASN